MKHYPDPDDEPIVDKLSDIDLTSSTSHQKVSRVISGELYIYLKGQDCQVFSAPFDVRLTHRSKADHEITTVVQPDICVVCDASKIDDRGCLGAPDIVVEILSPGNNKKELNIKYHLYEEFGVREYWVVHPVKRSLMKYTLSGNGEYENDGLFKQRDQFTSKLLPGFTLNLSEVFA